MAKTTNKYWIFLENLRRSGQVNMFGAAPFLVQCFDVDIHEARSILSDWMNNYNREDYDSPKCETEDSEE